MSGIEGNCYAFYLTMAVSYQKAVAVLLFAHILFLYGLRFLYTGKFHYFTI